MGRCTRIASSNLLFLFPVVVLCILKLDQSVTLALGLPGATEQVTHRADDASGDDFGVAKATDEGRNGGLYSFWTYFGMLTGIWAGGSSDAIESFSRSSSTSLSTSPSSSSSPPSSLPFLSLSSSSYPTLANWNASSAAFSLSTLVSFSSSSSSSSSSTSASSSSFSPTSTPSARTQQQNQQQHHEHPSATQDELRRRLFSSLPRAGEEHVLIVTPIKGAAKYLDRYFEALLSLSYPHSKLSLCMIESDSNDGGRTKLKLQKWLPRLMDSLHRVVFIQRNFNFFVESSQRHSGSLQPQRRAILARNRNLAERIGLEDEDWVFWVDVDVATFDADVLQVLLSVNASLVAPHVVWDVDGRTYDRNSWVERFPKTMFGEDFPLLRTYRAKESERRRRSEEGGEDTREKDDREEKGEAAKDEEEDKEKEEDQRRDNDNSGKSDNSNYNDNNNSSNNDNNNITINANSSPKESGENTTTTKYRGAYAKLVIPPLSFIESPSLAPFNKGNVLFEGYQAFGLEQGKRIYLDDLRDNFAALIGDEQLHDVIRSLAEEGGEQIQEQSLTQNNTYNAKVGPGGNTDSLRAAQQQLVDGARTKSEPTHLAQLRLLYDNSQSIPAAEHPLELVVPLHSVGSAVLLVRAEAHREGLIFPEIPHRKRLESEGLGLLALDMGYSVRGLPRYQIKHYVQPRPRITRLAVVAVVVAVSAALTLLACVLTRSAEQRGELGRRIKQSLSLNGKTRAKGYSRMSSASGRQETP